MIYSPTKLEDNALEKIQKLEKEIGKTLVALTGFEVNSSDLNEDQLSKVQKAEKELGVVLVAVNA